MEEGGMIFTCYEPSTGRQGGKAAIVSGYYSVNLELIIVAVDYKSVDTQSEEEALIHSHYKKIKEKNKDAKFVFIMGNGLPLAATHVQKMVPEYVEVYCAVRNKPGVLISKERIADYHQTLFYDSYMGKPLHFESESDVLEETLRTQVDDFINTKDGDKNDLALMTAMLLCEGRHILKK